MTNLLNTTILVSGNGSNMQALYESLHLKVINNIKINFNCMVSNKKDAYALTRAKTLGLKAEVIESKNMQSFELELLALLKRLDSKLVLLAGFMKILSKSSLSSLKQEGIEILNIHPSYLPLHKGANGIKDSYYDDLSYGGVSVHYVDSKVDSGEIILQEKLEKGSLSFEEYERQIHILEHKVYNLAIKKLLESK